jgi:hypothetical protein
VVIVQGGSDVLLQLAGSYTGDSFSVTADGSGGSDLTIATAGAVLSAALLHVGAGYNPFSATVPLSAGAILAGWAGSLPYPLAPAIDGLANDLVMHFDTP